MCNLCFFVGHNPKIQNAQGLRDVLLKPERDSNSEVREDKEAEEVVVFRAIGHFVRVLFRTSMCIFFPFSYFWKGLVVVLDA